MRDRDTRNRIGGLGGESFASYYLKHVAISEGCGCSDLVVQRPLPRPEATRDLLHALRDLLLSRCTKRPRV